MAEVSERTLEVIKCIDCGWVSHTDTGVCDSCDSSDIYASIVGESIELDCIGENPSLLEWAQMNSFYLKVTKVDHLKGEMTAGCDSKEGFVECPFAITPTDLGSAS